MNEWRDHCRGDDLFLSPYCPPKGDCGGLHSPTLVRAFRANCTPRIKHQVLRSNKPSKFEKDTISLSRTLFPTETQSGADWTEPPLGGRGCSSLPPHPLTTINSDLRPQRDVSKEHLAVLMGDSWLLEGGGPTHKSTPTIELGEAHDYQIPFTVNGKSVIISLCAPCPRNWWPRRAPYIQSS